MGCFDKCLRCLSLVPWASLIATVICWAGTALFCGTGHEALTYSIQLLNSSNITGFSFDATAIDEGFYSFQYAIYGIAGFMFLFSLLLFIDGVQSTRAVKTDFDDGCKTTCCGTCFGVMYTIVAYLCGICWLGLTCLAVLPLHFFIIAYSQGSYANNLNNSTQSDLVCLDFVQAGIMLPPTTSTEGYGRLCGDGLVELWNSITFRTTYSLFVIAFVGSALALLSMKQYLMCLSANMAYLKMAKKLAVYEDAKYREEMELNDIINTARSHERLTYKY